MKIGFLAGSVTRLRAVSMIFIFCGQIGQVLSKDEMTQSFAAEVVFIALMNITCSGNIGRTLGPRTWNNGAFIEIKMRNSLLGRPGKMKPWIVRALRIRS
ncbi:unnamed protein product [Prunus armeniaca]|uniref:Uncharacterized protein n=1 Tax=Prunus armeniaca TaxID=36596 RepID=A0A6J5WHG0_PRUAR|nr:unnamed protein product [Prunus armeniaca]